MQYTTQQFQGGPKYSVKTRIGNWNEDLELNRIQENNYQTKKQTGTLPFASTISKYQQSYRQVPWSYSADGNLHWNDNVMIQNDQTQGFLVMDIGDRVQNVEEGYSISSTSQGQNPGPMTRSVFKIVKENNPNDLFTQDECIRYGQYVRIQSNEFLFRKNLNLQSQKQTPNVCAALSQHQIAYLSAARSNADGIWILDHIDPMCRFEMQGECVKAGDQLLIRHVTTNVFLGADDCFKIKNDFGSENEVHCFNHSTNNKSQNLALESDGRLTVDVPTKFQKANNVFCIQTAPDAQYARPVEELAKFNMADCMKDLRTRLYERSAFGIRALTSIYSAMNAECLDCDDFRWGLMDFGVQLSKEDATELAAHFNQGGKVNWRQFLDCLKGSENWNDNRCGLIMQAFEHLDTEKSGSVRLDHIAQCLQAAAFPYVADGSAPEREAYMEFMAQFPTQDRDTCINCQEFVEVHRSLSGAIEDCAVFAPTLKGLWGM